MESLLRPYQIHRGVMVLATVCAAAALRPQAGYAQATEITQLLREPSPLLLTSSAQGYLGVLVGDVDADSAAKFKLKEVRGAVITLIDHDAPAGQILKVNDVVLEVNGQQVESAEQLRRMLREIPPGHRVTLVVSRDGAEQTLATQMGDQKKIEKSVWMKMSNGGDLFGTSGPGMGILPGGDTLSGSSGWRFSIFGSSLKVGAMVEPLTSQMADYFGVSSGLMVKQVARKTEAAAAGLKAFDVILKVGADPIGTVADWERALQSNRGRSVQLTVLRDRKQQTLTLQVDSKHKGELEMEDLFSDGDCLLVAELDLPGAEQLVSDSREAGEEVGRQAEALQEQIRNGIGDLKIDPKQAEEMRKQAEALRDQLRNGLGEFKIDPQQAEEMRLQAEALRNSLKGMSRDQFKFDRKQMDDLKRQMEEWKKNFNPDSFKIDPKQMEQFKQQMEEWQKSFKNENFGLSPQWN